MTEQTLRAIAVARRIARGEVVVDGRGEVVDELTHVDLALAIVDLVGTNEDVTPAIIQRRLADRSSIDRLVFALHRARAHPDYEYATTQTARKSGDDPRWKLEGDGWEPNDVVECHEYKDGDVVREHWRNWERFEFHEDNYWRRRKSRP